MTNQNVRRRRFNEVVDATRLTFRGGDDVDVQPAVGGRRLGRLGVIGVRETRPVSRRRTEWGAELWTRVAALAQPLSGSRLQVSGVECQPGSNVNRGQISTMVKCQPGSNVNLGQM